MSILNHPLSLALAVCTRNRGAAIIPTLEAIAAMDPAGGRLRGCIVVDNNSADDTAAVVADFAARPRPLPFVKVFEPAQGLSEARRRALHECGEDIVAFIDDDCIPESGWAAAILAAFDASPRVGAAGGRITLQFERPPVLDLRRWAPLLAQQDLGGMPRRLEGPRESLVGAALAVRRSAVEECGWLTRRLMPDRVGDTLTSGGDSELCVRIRRAGYTVEYAPGAAARHVIPARRLLPAYLDGLRRGIARSDPWIDWIAAGEPGAEWVCAGQARAARRLLRTRLLEWRPARRRRRLAEREARLEGWRSLRAHTEGPRGAGS